MGEEIRGKIRKLARRKSSARLVGGAAGAGDRGERAFEDADHLGYANPFNRPGQHLAATAARLAFDEAPAVL